MKKYKVKVNGKTYEVELEAVEKFEEVKESRKEEPKAADKPLAGSKEVAAPIGGKVLDIRVKIGERVAQDQTIMIIEAMKLENEIHAPFAGKVADIRVKVGDDVRNKDVLLVME